MNLHVRLLYLRAVVVRLVWLGDTLPIRVLVACASITFALLVTLSPDTFERRSFSGMGQLVTQFEIGRSIGPVAVWGGLFLMHGLGVIWRVLEERRRIYWALAINWLGWALWAIEIAATSYSLREVAAGNALEIPTLMALTVALMRTGLNDEKVSA